jgi:hypothetical protein
MDEVDRDEAGPLHDQPSYGRPVRVPSRPADPRVVFEVLVADGELAGPLEVEQARAVKEVLEWLADQTTQDQTTEDR